MLEDIAFSKKDLLERDVAFKEKFYYSKGAHYETATLKTVMLMPKSDIIDDLRKDYIAMGSIIYGKMPAFDEILEYLSQLEKEIHNLY